MQWSNAALKEENIWYSALAHYHKKLMEEVAANLDKLETNSIGVLDEKVRASAVLFDEKTAVKRLETMGRKLMANTMRRFGAAAQREAEGYYEKALLEKADPDVSFDLKNPEVAKYIDTRAYEFAKETTDTLLQQLRGTWNTYLKDGIRNNKTIDELTQDVEQVFVGTERADWAKARRIARTESVGSANMGAYMGYKEAGVPYKQWLTMRDKLVRDTHADVEGEVIGIDEYFMVGGKKMLAPGDSSGGPREIIHCRCTIIPVFAEPGAKPRRVRTPRRAGVPVVPEPAAPAPPVPQAVPVVPKVPAWEVVDNSAGAIKQLQDKYGFGSVHSDSPEIDKVRFFNATGAEMENILLKVDAGIAKDLQNVSINEYLVLSKSRFDNSYGKVSHNIAGFYRHWPGHPNELVMNTDSNGFKRVTSSFNNHYQGEYVFNNCYRDTFRHETGHHVWHTLLTKKTQIEWEENIFMRQGENWFKKNVTVYSGKNEKESFAESFGAYFHPEYKRGWLPKEVEDFFDKNLALKKPEEKRA